MGKKKLHPVITDLLRFAEGVTADGIPSDLQGTAANVAIKVLLQDWQYNLMTNFGPQDPIGPQNLVSDVDLVIEHLQAFRAKAVAVLPPEFIGNAERPTKPLTPT